MDEQALNDAYSLFTRQGYSGTIDQFKKLISTNKDALNDSYQIFRAQGYNGDINNYSTLVGVKKKTSSTISTPDSEVGMEDLQNGFDFSPTIFEAPAVLTPKKQKEYIEEQKLKPVKAVEPKVEESTIPKGFETYQAPSKEGEQGLGLNILSSLNRSIYKNLIGSPIKGLGTLIEGATSLLPRQIRSETGKGIISESLIDFGNYFNNAIDEISPQDEAFKNSLTDQFAQAFGQVASTIMTAGFGTAASKGLSLASKAPSMLAKPLSARGAALAATKEAGEQIIGPVGISSALTMGQSEYERAKEAGASDEQAFEAFYKNAVTGSVLETIPVMQFMKRFNQGTKGGLVNYIKTKGVAGLTGGVEEMTTEVLQTIYSNKTAQEIYNENQDIFEGIKEAGGIGFGVGFLLNAMGANAKILRKEGKDAEADVLENQIEEIQSRIENGPPAVYKINGLKIESPQIVSDMIERMDAPDLSKLNIEIDNDPVLKTKLQDKIITSSIMAQVREANPELNEPSLKAITELEKQLTLLEGNKTQTGKDKAAAIRTQIKNIQENQLQEEAVTETITAEAPEDAEIGNVEVAELKDVESTVKTMDDFDTFKDAVGYNVRRTADIGVDESEANYGNAKNINEIKSDLEKAGIQVEKVPQSSMSDGNYASFDGDKIKVTDENIPLQVLLHEIGEKVILDLDKAKQKIEHANNIFEAVTTYGASRGNDAFSDNFYLYFLSPKTLKDLSPNVYAELDKIIPDNIKDLGKSLMSKYGVTEQTLKYNKPQTDAIQEQAAGQVPVLTETGVSQEVPEGEPKTEPQVLTEEVVQEEEVKAPEITRESIRSLTDEEINPLYDEIPLRLLPTVEGVSKQDAVFEAYFKSKKKNTNPELVQAVEKVIIPAVSLKTQPVQEVAVAPEVIAPEVVAEEQFVPITVPDIQFDIRFSRDEASDVVEGEREGDNGRTYNYISEVETAVSDADGTEIGYLVKMIDDDKNLTFEARDENGNNLSKNDEGFATLGEARQALLDNINKANKKEFTKEAKAKAKAKEKEVAKKAKAKAKAETKKPAKVEPSTETEEEQVARMMELFEKGTVATTDSGISVTNKSQIDNIKGKITDKLKLKVIESAQKALKTLKSVLPNFDIIIHDNEGSYNSAMISANGTAGTSGNFSYSKNKDGSYSGRIDINLNKANARTVAHEVAHGIMLKTFGDKPALFKNFRDRISTVLKESTNKELNDFASRYEGDVAYEEYLAELTAILEQQEGNIPPNILQKIAAIINAVVSKITNGTLKPFENIKDTKEIMEFFSGVAKSIREGEDVKTKEPSISKKEKEIAAKIAIVEDFENKAANKVKKLSDLLGFNLGKPVSKSQASNAPLPVNTQVANGFDILKKKFGETAAKSIRENIPFALDYPNEFAEFITKKIPVKEDIAFIVKNISQRLDGLFRLESDKNIETVKVVNKTPEELSKEAGYVFHRPESENDILAFKKDFANGEVLCTYNDVEGRMQGHFIFWLRRNDAESVLPAKQITQEYLKDKSEGSALWRAYLDGKKLKMPDGSYDLSNVSPSRQDPYGTSSMSVQIGRRGGNISIKNRYNHTVNNPDATFGNDLNTIIDGLDNAVFGIEGIPKKASQELRLPDNITSDLKGRFFKYDQEVENIYFSQHGYVAEGEIVLIDKSHQRMVDNFIFDSKTNEVIPITLSRQLIRDINKIAFEKNKIIVNSDNGNYEFEFLNGTLNKLSSDITNIGDSFLYYNTTLESISLPNVKSIDNTFLRSNKNLKSISLPSVTDIGNSFLRSNVTLESISLPNVVTIGTDFLLYNEDLKSISLPNVEEIGDGFIKYNNLLENISLPRVKIINDDFLKNNLNLKSIELPNVDEIGDWFLNENYNLTNVELPNVTQIGFNFLKSNISLRSISLPNVINIGNSFLNRNTNLRSISLPKVTRIGGSFLENSTILESISLPNVQLIGNYFIARNQVISNVELPNVRTIDDDFLRNNYSLKTISLPNVINIGANFLRNNENLKSISLPNVEEIGDNFLNTNEGLESISLPRVRVIGRYFMIYNSSVERPVISKSQKNNVSEINKTVNDFRAQGFSESAIKTFLIQQGFSATEANQILNISPIQGEFDSLMSKVDKLIARQKSRGIEDGKITSNIDIYIRKQDEYLNANDAQKKIIEREARAKMGAAPKRAVSIGRVLGALKDITNISRAEKMLVIKQIRDLSRDAVKELAKELRLMASSGKITSLQAANIVARFGKVNMLSEISVSKFVDYMAKVFENAEYAAKLSLAKSLKKDISKLSKDKNKNANLKDLGSRFINIKPSMVEDIDAYNEMASKIKEAIKGSTIRGAKINFADTVNIKNAIEYINKTIETQDEMMRQEKAAEIQDLMDVDVSDLSYDDMMLMLDSKEPITKYNEGIIRGAINKAFKIYSSIIKNTISTGKDQFTDEDVTFTKNQKRIITEFMNMNLNELEPKEALMAVDALVNFLQNNSVARMDTVVAEYTSLINSKKLVKDGVKARLLRKYGSTAIGQFFAEQTTTLPVLIEKMFPGVSRSRYVMKMMGLTDLINKSSAAKTEARNIVNDYVKQFYKRTANGEAFNTAENNIERDMAARLIRTIIGTESQMQEEFNRRKEVLKESIAMLSEGNEKEVALSILYQKVYDKLVGPSKGPNQNQKGDNEANNIQEVKDRVDKTNLEAIDFWIKNWGDRYDRFSEVSEGVYNTILEKDLNYTPDKFSLLSLESESIELGNEESAFQKNSGQLYDKKSATLNKVTQPGAKEIRKANRYLNLSFDQNMANLMQDALIDVNTAASIKQVNAFLNSPNFRKIFPNQDDALIIKGDKNTVGRVQLYVNNLRNKNNFTSDELSSAMRKLDKVAAFGVSLALGTVSQVPKQTLSVAVNTLINSGRLPDLSTLTNIDKINFINNSGRDIANRGIGSQAEIESINKLIEKAASSTGEKAIKLIEEANSKWINLLLVKPDVAIARGSWLTYYEQSLRKQGIDTKGLDYKTHKINDEAADYASTQVGRQQNISDHDLSGKLFSNEQALAKWFVKTMMAFSSFRMNAASRLGADLTTLNDKTSTREDKLTAARSIAGFGAELAVFKLVSIVLTVAWGSLTKLISGEEEDEDEFNKRKRLAIKAHRSSIPSDIFSPLPIIDPFFQKLVAAPILNKIEEVTGLPVSIYATPNNKSIFAELGSLGIAGDRILRIIELGKLAATGKYTDDYGNEQTIPEKKRESLVRFVPLSILASIGVIPQEGNTLAMNAMKYAKSKGSYNDSLTRRALDRWSSSVDLEEYPQVAEFIENKRKELAGEGDQAQQREELGKLKKSLLEGYDDKNQMNAVDPELYRKNFGENSDWVKKGYAKKDAMESKYNSALSKKEKMIEIEDLKAEENKIK